MFVNVYFFKSYFIIFIINQLKLTYFQAEIYIYFFRLPYMFFLYLSRVFCTKNSLTKNVYELRGSLYLFFFRQFPLGIDQCLQIY